MQYVGNYINNTKKYNQNFNKNIIYHTNYINGIF